MLAQEVRDRLGDDAKYLDMIYGTKRNFRLLYCRKYNKGWLGPPKTPVTKGFSFRDSLVQP